MWELDLKKKKYTIWMGACIKIYTVSSRFVFTFLQERVQELMWIQYISPSFFLLFLFILR